MKLKEVGFSESIQLVDGHWIKAWASVEGDAGDDPEIMWAIAKDHVKSQISDQYNKYQISVNPEYAHHLQPPLQYKSDVTRMQVIQTDKTQTEASADLCTYIFSCKELKVLETYKFIVKGKPELQEAYDEMYLKLSK